MTSKVYVVTVPHTGTHFTVDLLRHHFQVNLRPSWVSCPEKPIIPLRHPRDVLVSWVKRGEYPGNFYEAWNCLPEDAHWLPVDHPTRDGFLGNLAEHLGVRLDTDWTPLNSKPKSVPVPDVDLSPIFDLPIVRELYADV